jgi:AraC-like DNA-binding protein
VALLHAQPARGWTVDSLAREAAASRSQLAERFSRMLGCPPMEYLTRWRMQLSARRMLEGSEPLKDIAIAAGYESDSGFNRTFRRYFGEPPAHWRRRHRE